MRFNNRENELAALEKAYSSKGANLVIITGRRRIGKSRLIDEFARNKKAIAAFIVPKEEKQVAKDLEEAIRLTQGYSPPLNTLKDVFEYLLKQNVPLIILDEFSNILTVNESTPYELQRIWDANKDTLKTMLIVSGSYAGMMNRLFSAKKAPLFNRATMTINVQPLGVGAVTEILGDLGVKSPIDKVSHYCVFGGIPYYYVLIEKLEKRSFLSAVESLFFEVGAQLKEEGENILRQEFGNAYPKYYAILEAISAGHVSMNEISQQVGVRATTLSKYMNALQHEFRLVERTVPYGQSVSRSKKGQYENNDNMLAFWFSQVYGKLTQPTEHELNSFVARRFERLSRDVLIDYAKARGERPISAGRWWGTIEVDGEHQQSEIDVVVDTNKTLYLGECKWTEKKVGKTELNRLREKRKAISETKKPVRYVLFAKTGFDIKEDDDTLLFDADRITDPTSQTRYRP